MMTEEIQVYNERGGLVCTYPAAVRAALEREEARVQLQAMGIEPVEGEDPLVTLGRALLPVVQQMVVDLTEAMRLVNNVLASAPEVMDAFTAAAKEPPKRARLCPRHRTELQGGRCRRCDR